MKKFFVLITIFSIFLITIMVSVFKLTNEEGYLQPEDKIVASIKDVGSDNMGFSKAEASVPQIAKMCDLIVVGEIQSDILETKSIEIIPEGSEFEAKFNSLYSPDKKPKDYVHYYKFKADEVIYGSLENSTFTFSKLAGQSNIKKGQKVLMLLIKDNDANDDNTYCSAALEDGIFTIDNTDTITSLSNNMYTSAYDGYKKDRLMKDISKALKDDKIKPLIVKVKNR